MGTQELVALALKLDPAERFDLVEQVLHSLVKPDPDIDRIWIDEAERRLASYRAGKVQGVLAKEIFGESTALNLQKSEPGPVSQILHSTFRLAASAIEINVRTKLAEMEAALLQAPARRMFESDSWADDIPHESGVYAVWDLILKTPVYVGETSALRSRMSDIGRKVNHTFRRKVAKLLNINSNDEAVLSAAMAERYAVSFVEVQLGRAELEDFLILRWRKTILNNPAKRLLRGERYTWVEPATNPSFQGTLRDTAAQHA